MGMIYIHTHVYDSIKSNIKIPTYVTEDRR